MLLIEDGKMTLDQPIADFLPAFANMTVQNTPDGSLTDVRPAKGPITVRQLLTHTAGLGYNIIQKGPIKAAYDRAGIVGGQRSEEHTSELQSLMRISYAVFCLKKKNQNKAHTETANRH